jgi:aromatic ring-opening dioxygenase LigB subunit
MSLVFACVSAHTPLLMPTIAKDSISLVDKTRQAMLELEKELYLAKPDTLVVITPHGPSLPDSVVINMSPEYITNFEEFGDLVTKSKWKSCMMLIDRIREDFKLKHLPLSLDSVPELDYGAAVPLWYLTQHLPDIKVIPVVTSQLDMKTHYNIGKELKDELMSSINRVAVIASADLSHRVGEQSPEGLSPKGVAFDDKVLDMITKGNVVGMLDFDEEWLAEAKCCGSKVLATLAGVLDEVKYSPRVFSYERPFGVGYLVAEMKIA